MTTPNLITTKNGSVEAGKKQKLKDPNVWFIEKFPAVYARYNMPLETAYTGKPKVLRVKQLSDVFFAAVFGELGFPNAPTYYTQGSFYTYNYDVGIYEKISDGGFETRLCDLIQQCAKDVRSKKVDTDKLMFDLSNSSRLSGVVKRAKAILEKPDTFFDNSDAEFIPCSNGMLRIEERTLVPFSHRYRIRNKLDVDYTIGAKCPLFTDKLLAEALDPDQIDLAQRWSGMALLGANVDHRILVIKGNAGAGKSTFINVVIGIVGHHNIGELRTDQLGGRFELGNLVGKRVLIGNDVPSDFLLQKGTSKLKSMVAGDPISAEIKGVTGQISMKGDFNIAIASNGVVSIRIDKDLDAWSRRLLLLQFDKPKPKVKDTALLKKILKNEKPGVLNWMLDGLDKLRKDDNKFTLNKKLSSQGDNFLMSSRAPELFVEDRLEEKEGGELTKEMVTKCYHEYCKERDWPMGGSKDYPARIEAKIAKMFGITVSNSLKPKGKDQGTVKGWYGVQIIDPDL